MFVSWDGVAASMGETFAPIHLSRAQSCTYSTYLHGTTSSWFCSLQYSESAPPHLVISPGSTSYARHVEEQARRHRRGLRLARGTGRQPPGRNSVVAGAADSSDSGSLTSSAAAAHGGEDDPLRGRRVENPAEQLRRDNPDRVLKRTAREGTERDPRSRFYRRLQSQFRAQIEAQVQEEAEEGHGKPSRDINVAM